jgi:adenine phosphoribosyltransferase
MNAWGNGKIAGDDIMSGSQSSTKLAEEATDEKYMDELKKLIREVPDFPKPGINFYDITTLLKHPDGLRQTVDALAAQYEGAKIDTVVGIEARGFIFAPALAYHLGAGFVPVRKPKKLPAERASISYDLEYGQDTLEIHRDAIGAGDRVIIADDLLATGGTARAVCDLVEGLGGTIEGLVFVVELEFLPGRKKLQGYDVRSLIKYQS